MKRLQIAGIIPARYQSRRFPGKPLAPILGKSLIQRTYENAKKIDMISELYVATEDTRIFEHVEGFGGKAIYTPSDCLTGSDRVAEAAKNLSHADIIVNIQGDEPCLDPEAVNKAIKGLIEDQEAVVATAVTALEEQDACNPSVVKCVFDRDHRALYFSRSLIPGNKSGKWSAETPCFRHVGLYVFRRHFLLQYAELSATPLMLAEDLEQLKILEHGYKIHVVHIPGISLGVDLPHDIEKVENYLCQQNMSL